MVSRDDLIETIYEATYQPDRWPLAMAALATLTGARSAALFIHDKELKQVNGFFPHGVPKATAVAYRKFGARLDPGFKRMRDVPVGVSRSIVDLSAPDREIDLFEQLMLRPAGIHAILGINLINSERIHAGIGIHRSREQGSFEPAAWALVESVAPHFARAIKIYREFAKVSACKHALQAGLERLSVGTVLFDHLAKPIYMNPRARYLFERHPATRLRGDLPMVVDRMMAQRVQNAVIGVIEGEIEELTFGLLHPGHGSPLVVRVVSVKAWEDAPIGFPGLARCAMYVTDPELSPSVPPEVLRQVYGLTAAESEVALGLANGSTLDEIAGMHGVAKETVRSQLKSVFQKVGVSRQSDVVRIVLSLPVVYGEAGA